ncbi:MAG: histidine kinase [Clostridiales bacterium]|nr:histidine kinase [Clostridiales bacterium]
MFKFARDLWLNISLKKKLTSFTLMMIIIMALSLAFNIQILNFSLNSFYGILDDNARCNDLQKALENETAAFGRYIKERSAENKSEYEYAREAAVLSVMSLPFDYRRIGSGRYAMTWNVRNGYEGYALFRDNIAVMDPEAQGYIKSLYKVYAMQEYLLTYARRLSQTSMSDGNALYQEKTPALRNIPLLILTLTILMVAATMALLRLLSATLISPVVKLAKSSRNIANNNFTDADLAIDNKDEMGELVSAFNKMKHATAGYIRSLEENNIMTVRLHKEELTKLEMERRLDAINMELLRSQIHPHFLFNTLGMIAGTAKLEEAGDTERMIVAMSNLFRYNLKTTEQTVSLERELTVIKDYIYLQRMRFGSRISFSVQVEESCMDAYVPVFILQPLVENAVIHGLSKEERGGRVLLRIWRKAPGIIISVADTGAGMDAEKLSGLTEGLTQEQSSQVGIGLGNIFHRIHALYPNGDMRIYSRLGRGTAVQLIIPQGGEYVQAADCRR